MGETDTEAPTAGGRSLKRIRVGDGVRRFQHQILKRIASDRRETVEKVVADTVAWLETNPNPNDPEIREYRGVRNATARDALLHVAVLKKQGGLDRGWMGCGSLHIGVFNEKTKMWIRRSVSLETEKQEEARAAMPDVPSWVDA